VWREVRFFFGGKGASVELCQIFDVLDFTYVGLHTSTDAKDIFFAIAKTKKRFFLVVMSSRCQGGGLYLWSKTTKFTQQHHDKIYIVAY
jgi:hypothetical protein